MGQKLLSVLTISALGIMIGLNASSRDETLPVEDGRSAAAVLPLDRDSSKTAFQTATFGLG